MRPATQNLTRKVLVPQLQAIRSNNDPSKASSNTIAGLYDLGDTIGKGHYAVVKVAHHVFTGEKVAVKVIDKNKLDDVSKAHLFQEVRCMKLVQHANVVKLYQVIDTQSKLYLILEYADGGDLFDYIMKHSEGLDEHLARDYFRQILHAIDFCHKLHVVHRDLKPENVVFFKSQQTVKLTDFGFSNKFVPGNKLDTSCGSLAYSAPEILLGVSYDAPAVDIWSLGVVLYMLVCGQAPFQEANDSETLTMIMDCKYSVPDYVSTSCKQLIGLMLVRDPNKRATLKEIMSHEWLTPAHPPPSPLTPELPLVCRQALTMDDHNEVVDKMVVAGFATLPDITQSLDNQAYDHITATYYLLAERLLRKRLKNPIPTTSPHLSPDNPTLSPLALSPRSTSPVEKSQNMSTPTDIEAAVNRTPIECLVSPPGNSITPSASSSNFLSNEPSDIHKLRQQLTLMQPPSPHKASVTSTPFLSPYSLVGLPPPIPGRPICNVHSSPQLLNEICEEEDESESEEPVPLEKISSRRREKRHRVLGGRPGGCSSEDVSDSEEARHQRMLKQEGGKEKDGGKKTESRQIFGGCGTGLECSRRDSSEHSSDTDGGGCFRSRIKSRAYRYHQQNPLSTSHPSNSNHNSSNNSYGSRRHASCKHASCPDNSDNDDNHFHYSCSHSNRRNHANPLQAALLKLNVPQLKRDDVEEPANHSTTTTADSHRSNKHCLEHKGSKLFSVLEENSPPSSSYSYSTQPPQAAFPSHHFTPTRKASSLINISTFLSDQAPPEENEEDDDGDDGSHGSCCCYYCYHDTRQGVNTSMHSSFSSSSSSSLSCLHSLLRSLDLNQPLPQPISIHNNNLWTKPSLQLQHIPSCG